METKGVENEGQKKGIEWVRGEKMAGEDEEASVFWER